MKKGANYVTQPMLTLNAIDGNVVSRMFWLLTVGRKRAGSSRNGLLPVIFAKVRTSWKYPSRNT